VNAKARASRATNFSYALQVCWISLGQRGKRPEHADELLTISMPNTPDLTGLYQTLEQASAAVDETSAEGLSQVLNDTLDALMEKLHDATYQLEKSGLVDLTQ